MGVHAQLRRKVGAVLTAGSLVGGVLVATMATVALAPAASAEPGPIAQPSAATVTTDALPTAQMDGVAWSQKIIGNTVYVGGSFAKARPAGAAAGSNLTARSNFLAYNLTTGVLNTAISPSFNQQIYAVSAASDNSRVYAAGQFTQVNGTTRNRLVALNPTTGAPITGFTPNLNYIARAVVATPTTVYVAGAFTTANGQTRTRLAAYSVATGALTTWAPTADDTINAMVLSPDGALIIGGKFQNVNGSPAYGLAKLDAATGALLPWNATNLIRNAGAEAAILSLSTDGDAIYGTGYHFGAGGNLEGTFSADPASGDINWVEDCHGDTYDAWPAPTGVIYTVSHAHYCGNIGGFPQSDPWATNMRRGLAFTKNATGTAGHDPHGYYDFFGTPSPSMINWFPEIDSGKYTGSTQGAWTVTGNAQYVVMGGEFPRVNRVGQQGLVRFAVRPIAPAKIAPTYSGSNFLPTVLSMPSGTARVSWQANSDKDSKTLTYTVLRNNVAVHTVTADSTFWNRPTMGFIDTTVVPGTAYRYRVTATDPDGNVATGNLVDFTASAGGGSTAYAQRVTADGAAPYWPMDETSGTSLYDNAGFTDADLTAAPTRGVSGAISGNAATTFNGSITGATRTAVPGPNVYTAQAWIRTTSISGGKILGFGNAQTGNSSGYDRHVYLDSQGRVFYGVYNNQVSTLNSAAGYNDGQWHQITTSLGPDGMKLWIDATLIAQRADVTVGQDYSGYWRVGGDNLGGWPNVNASNFTGDIDEVAVYPTVLTRAKINAQWMASGRNSVIPAAPADAYGAAVYDDDPLLFWRLGETSGTSAKDSGQNGDQTGVYQNGVTQGAPGAIKGTTDTAAQFDGNDDLVASTNSFSNPKNYTLETWVKTTSTNGGKIIGFGASQTGTSGSYDRHIYVNNDGRVSFGTYTGQLNIATAPTPINDGVWHQVVASQSTTAGMKLYVDGVLVAGNPQTDAQDYSGFWRVGGDNHWGCCSPFLDGTIDDVAVYNKVLTEAQVANHYALGSSSSPANQSPTAAFTSAVTDLSAAFDGTGSADADGTIASYAWTFGDGGTSTQSAPTHPYAAAGTFDVTLTVTDNQGATGVKNGTVTVTAPNQAPTAAFTSTVTNLSVAFDAGTSSDADGTIASYAWTYGDGGTGSTATPTHVYAAAGTYPVKLTVTDNQGGTGTITKNVTVSAANQAPVASFTAQAVQLTANVDASASSDPDGTIASYARNFGDGATATTKTASHTYASAGSKTITLTVTDNGGASTTSSQPLTVTAPPANQAPVASFTLTKSDLTVNTESTSTDPDGTIVGQSWNFGDGTPPVTTAAATHTYAEAGTFTITLTVTDISGGTNTKTQGVTVTAPPVGNVAPTASFTTSAAGLTLTANGSASGDTDGTIAAYAWNYGDGATDMTTTPTTTHAYTADGTYTVTLTVTDDDGATGTLSKSVTVSSPAPATLASDAFGRTSASGWGAADLGGAWAITGGSANFSVASGTGRIKMAAKGSGPTATLAGIGQADTDATVEMSLDKVPTGGGVYVSVASRKVGTSEYRVTTKFLANGSVQMQLLKIVSGTATSLRTTTVTGFTYVAGDQVTVRFRVTGTGTVTLSAKIWKTGTGQPSAWTTTAADVSSTLTTAGSFALYPYLTGSSTNAPLTATFDNMKVAAAQ